MVVRFDIQYAHFDDEFFCQIFLKSANVDGNLRNMNLRTHQNFTFDKTYLYPIRTII